MNSPTRQRLNAAINNLAHAKSVDAVTKDMLSDLAEQYADTRGFETREQIDELLMSARILNLRIVDRVARCCPTVLNDLRVCVYCLTQIKAGAPAKKLKDMRKAA